MGNQRWQGNVSNAWNAGGNWIGDAPGVIPADGDTVSFLAADLGANVCAVGPVAAVTLISITDDAGFAAAAGGNPIICYVNITVTTVTVLSACYIGGGTIATLTLSGVGARVSGGATIDTAILDAGAVNGAATITTLYLNVSAAYGNNAGLTVTTVYLNGTNTWINAGTYGTVYMNGSSVDFRANAVATTVYVDSLNAEISATAIAAGQITNGPYVMNRDAVLYDYDTGFVMLDTSRVLLNHEGAW